ncbi:helix-turn-helix transcriptional regulator [Aestuariimicrobium kwangyangense]|uniref:helix-turn-helix transcriptional regulator n=1 Tax=Aestuariimicrobium kwangyangense TaxID=396389 RepID=UPI0003B43C69|nr:helix-turn-helix transcriptional regulator [Aestuariimicrobium kwangyangense]
MDNRREISEFLTSRRARVRPEDSGLPAHDDRRRVPGLKREEVSLLAGVSVDYYARLERGLLSGVSMSVLDGISDALKLDEAERQHLRDLAAAAAEPERRLRTRVPKSPTLRPSIRALLSGMTKVPAYVRNQRSDILAANDLCLALYDGILDELPLNLARFVFLDGRAHGFFLDWDDVADGTVGALRTEAGRNPMDKPLTDLIGELIARSHPFATKWAQHNVRRHRTATKHLHNSVVGDIELTGDALDLPGEGLTIVAYTAAARSAAEVQLGLLASWRGTTAPSSV